MIIKNAKISIKKSYPLLAAKYSYLKSMHRLPDLNDPKDFNEKIIYMLYKTDSSLWTTLADKYAVRQYLASKGHEDILVPLYGHWADPEDIDFGSLPSSFVLKPNNGSGSVIIVKDRDKCDIKLIKDRLRESVDDPYWCYNGEIQYRGISPQIIAEKLLADESGLSVGVIDYKFYCFAGEPLFCMVCLNRIIETHQRENAFYDRDWNRCDGQWAAPELTLSRNEVPRPINYGRMLELCRELCSDFPFVRLDLYEVGGKLYFSEFTFTPNGFKCCSLRHDVMSLMGSLIQLPACPSH